MLRDDQLVDIVLDKPRKMLFTLLGLNRAQREINKLRGDSVSIFKRIDEFIQCLLADDGNLPVDLIVVLIWASLLHEDPELTLEQADRMCTSNLRGLVAQLTRAMVPLISPHSEDAVMPAVLEEKKTMIVTNGRASGDSPESNLD